MPDRMDKQKMAILFRLMGGLGGIDGADLEGLACPGRSGAHVFKNFDTELRLPRQPMTPPAAMSPSA